MNDLHIALWQTPHPASTAEALQRLDTACAQARAQGAELLITPEMFLTGYAILQTFKGKPQAVQFFFVETQHVRFVIGRIEFANFQLQEFFIPLRFFAGAVIGNAVGFDLFRR